MWGEEERRKLDVAISEIIGGLEQYVEEIYGNERKSIEQN